MKERSPLYSSHLHTVYVTQRGHFASYTDSHTATIPPFDTHRVVIKKRKEKDDMNTTWQHTADECFWPSLRDDESLGCRTSDASSQTLKRSD